MIKLSHINRVTLGKPVLVYEVDAPEGTFWVRKTLGAIPHVIVLSEAKAREVGKNVLEPHYSPKLFDEYLEIFNREVDVYLSSAGAA